MHKIVSSFVSSRRTLVLLGVTSFTLLGATSSLRAQEPNIEEPAVQDQATTEPPKLPIIDAAEAARLAGAPTLLTLHVENGKAKDVFAEIRKQLDLPPGSNDFQLDHKDTPVTLHIEGQPFWSAMRTIAATTHFSMEEAESGRSRSALQFTPGDRGLEAPAVSVGPFLFSFSQAKRTQQSVVALRETQGETQPVPAPVVTDQLSLLMYVFADPKLQLVPGTSYINWEQVVDDKGNSLLANGGRSGRTTFRSDNRYVLGQFVNFTPKAGTGQRLAVIKGELHTFIVTKYDIWEVPDPLQVKDLTKIGAAGEANEKYVINEVKPAGNGYQARVTVLRPHLGFDFVQATDVLVNDITLFDAAGTALVNTGGSRRGLRGISDARATKFHEFEANATLKPSRSTITATAPVKLVWRIPVEFKEVVVPFEFKNLPLP